MTKNDKSLQIIIFIMLIIILSLIAICTQEPFPEMSPEKCTNYNELFKDKTDKNIFAIDSIDLTIILFHFKYRPNRETWGEYCYQWRIFRGV